MPQGLQESFDRVAAAYERLRPGYPTPLYQRMFDYMPIGPASNVLEVGIGGGQATLPVLQTGCRLTAVEYGPHLAALCREKFREYPGFSVHIGRFEEAALPPEGYDLIFSASAFHWVPEEVGYPKVFSLLKSGGAFARFANHPFADKGRPALWEEIQALYARYMGSTAPPAEYTEERAWQRAEVAKRYGFVEVDCQLYHRTRTFTAEGYSALLGTYSDHLALEEGKRRAFFEHIEQAIRRHGGEITLYDTIDLQLARKP